ncbi:MAG: ArnT family glycosyltransferase [Chloroflexota bacterium]
MALGSDPTRPATRRQPRISPVEVLPGAAVLLVLCVAYWLAAIRPSSHAYLDYVDGYYLYVSRRMAQGAVLYSGVMGVQPPGIYVVGAALFRLYDHLATARVYSGLLHCATILLVAAVSYRLTRRRAEALVAAAIYTAAPYGLLWSRLFDPNPLVTFLSLCSLWALLGDRTRWAGAAGILAALALLTKVWYLPVGAITVLWLAVRRREQLAPFVAGAIVPAILAFALGTLSAGDAFRHGLLVQDASPFSGSWFETSVYHVLSDDWPLLLLGLAGARAMWRRGDDQHRLIALWIPCSCLVVLATVKEGTAWPVFQFAEPFLAVGAAAFLGCLSVGKRPAGSRSAARLLPSPATLFVLLLLVLFALPAVRGASTWPNSGEDSLARALRGAAPITQPVLAPPFYLYLSGRRGVDQFADINLWGQEAERGDPQAVTALTAMVTALNRGAVPMVLADNRVRALTGVPEALRKHYRQLPLRDRLPVDRSVTVWVPR